MRDAERIQEVCKLVVNQMEEEGVRPHLVCSAMGKTTNNLLAAAERAINEQVVDLSAVRDLHADTAVKLGLVDSSEYADVLRLLDECERLTLTLALTLALALASASASPSLGASGHSRASRCSASSRRARATAWSRTASGARGAWSPRASTAWACRRGRSRAGTSASPPARRTATRACSTRAGPTSRRTWRRSPRSRGRSA